MNNFEFYNPARVIFGKNIEGRIGEQVAEFSKKRKCLLHYGGGSVIKSGLLDRVKASLTDAGISFVELSGVVPNPRLSLAQEGIRLCREHELDFVLAVGGGSVIDSAKCIVLGVAYEGDVWDYYLDNSLTPPENVLPVGVVLTIPAAGSETSMGSVITKEDEGLKRSYGSSCLTPRFAFINPALTMTLPPYQIACGCSDIMAHLMERYFTQVENVDVSDRMIEALLRTMLIYAPKALKDPMNYDVRAEICWAGTVAHNNLLNMGRIGDWGSHAIEHELSGMYDVAHGAGLAVVFPAWMKYVYKANKARFLQFAVRIMDIDLAMEHTDEMILDAIDKLEAFFRSLGLPTRLGEIGATEDKLREMAEKSQFASKPGNFVPLRADDVYEILKLAL
ncbi:iron-containing alcohol dehydrogenase [Oscillospiraceae bacterium PP1C4]